MTTIEEHIKNTWDKLKDFQKATAEYTLKQFIENGRNKMLIADEVGLGKTIVARGIVSKLYEIHHDQNPDIPFNVIYICSNQAIAKQNIEKLNFLQGSAALNVIDYNKNDDRISALAYKPKEINREFNIRIKAFTPGTSFDQNTSSGRSDERVLLFRLLKSIPALKDYAESLSWMMKSNRRMRNDNWQKMVEDALRFDVDNDYKPLYYWDIRPLRNEVIELFLNALDRPANKKTVPKVYKYLELKDDISWIDLIRRLCQTGVSGDNYFERKELKELLKQLRILLSHTCSSFLKADLFVLDEFQRYSKLLTVSEQDDPGIELARQVLNKKDSKVLMLSATPFKPYTNDFDELNGESHYSEFKQLLEFLLQNESQAFWREYQKDRSTFFNALRQSKSLMKNYGDAKNAKAHLEKVYRSCIARTERMLVSKNKDAMVHSPPVKLELRKEDIKDFIHFDQLVTHLNEKHNSKLAIPLEYVKSCPYPLSFLTQYTHKKKLERHYGEDPKLQRLVKKGRNGWLDLKKVRNYKPLYAGSTESIPNAKIRLLFSHTIENNGWKYLWVPPSLEYYPSQGAYSESHGYSKTLLFSAWKMVPRMVATMVSYEAERKTVGKAQLNAKNRTPNYFDKQRYPYPLLTFKVKSSDDSLQGMNNFMLCYPSLFLGELYDSEINLGEKKSLAEIKKELSQIIKERLVQLGVFEIGEENGDWQKWAWFSILLLDKNHSGSDRIRKWLRSDITESVGVDSNANDDKEESTGKRKHLDEVREVILNEQLPSLSKLTEIQLENIVDFAVNLCLGSPAISALRSFNKVFGSDGEYFEDAYDVATGFTSLFNKPESISIIQLNTNSKEYYNKVLEYCIDGNIQSMMDEYFYLMKDSSSIGTSEELADTVAHILAIRPSLLEVGSISELKKTDDQKQKERSRNRIRSHFAMDFGQQKISSGANRQVNLREAFNSPFRPFVLASTSIGQEGLDFHFYSKKIIHWNLPSNPIDFEQREGRIHRFKGHVIRLNLAKKLKEQLHHIDGKNIWDHLFEMAEVSERSNAEFDCDLIPNWHVETEDGYSIERIVPLYPFSRDIDKFKNMLKVLAYYRLTFGQPRQDELIEAMAEAGLNENDKNLMENLMLNLTPLTYA